ncbi:hypothetical protein EK904_006042, partial [Melospiza melodia maxima]
DKSTKTLVGSVPISGLELKEKSPKLTQIYPKFPFGFQRSSGRRWVSPEFQNLAKSGEPGTPGSVRVPLPYPETP